MKKILKGNSPENYIFIPNTKAYSIFLGREDKKETCKACSGKGRIELSDGKYYECPGCYGKGFNWVKVPEKWMLNRNYPEIITSINVRENEVVYFFGCNGSEAENVFSTKTEALKEIKKRNKKLEKNNESK